MRHSMSKDTAFNGETTPRHTFLCSDSQCLPPGDPRILCAKPGYPITGKSFIPSDLRNGMFFSQNNMPFTSSDPAAVLLLLYHLNVGLTSNTDALFFISRRYFKQKWQFGLGG